MVKQELLDDKLVLEQTSQYKLSIQVSLNGFSFCCLDSRTKRFVAVKDFAFNNVSNTYEEVCFNIENIVKEDNLLNLHYKEVRCMVINPMYTLVPTSLFSEYNKAAYLRSLLTVPESEVEFFARPLADKGITVVFAIPKIISMMIRGIAPNASFYHLCVPQVEKQLGEKGTGAVQLSIYLSKDLACYSLFKDGALKINTTFTYESTADLVYFTMLLLKEHGVKPADVEVHLSGRVEKQSSRYSDLGQFLPKLALDAVPKGYEYSYLFKYKAEHQFANLFKLVECE